MDTGQNKALAAAGGSGVGGAIATLMLTLLWPQADAGSAGAVTTLVTAVVAYLSAYLVPHNPAPPQ
jgi:hypothetical protein